MKKINIFMVSAMAMVFLASCSDTPDYPSGNEVSAGQVSATISSTTVTVEAVDATLPSTFIRGFDASGESDANRGSYEDASGNEKDIFAVLPKYGINWVRLRIWNNPDSDKNPSVPGASNLTVVLDQAKRAKANGLSVLLDFHYSDYWADPSKQLIPESWLDNTTQAEMTADIASYTKEVLQALADENAAPDMIQIGNEISSGILKHKAIDSDENVTEANSAVAGTFGSDNYFAYLKAGIDAAREVCPNAKIMLHFTDIKRNDVLANLSKYNEQFSSLDYDVVGLSYYPKWSSHGTIDNLGNVIKTIKSTYGKEVVIAETSVPNKISSTASYNYYGLTYEGAADSSDSTAANLTVNGSVYSGIVTDSKGIPVTYQNQANIIRAIVEVAAQNGASGFFTWGGEIKGSWTYGMFDSDGLPLASIVVHNVSGQ